MARSNASPSSSTPSRPLIRIDVYFFALYYLEIYFSVLFIRHDLQHYFLVLFLASHNCLIKGISAPQDGFWHLIVLAHI